MVCLNPLQKYIASSSPSSTKERSSKGRLVLTPEVGSPLSSEADRTHGSQTDRVDLMGGVSIMKHRVEIWGGRKDHGSHPGVTDRCPFQGTSNSFPACGSIWSLRKFLFEPMWREHLLSCNFLWFEIWLLQATRVGSLRKKKVTENKKQGLSLILAEYRVIFFFFNSNSS